MGLTLKCEGCRRRKELLRGYWTIAKNMSLYIWKTLTKEEG